MDRGKEGGGEPRKASANPDKGAAGPGRDKQTRRRWLPYLVFCLTLLLGLILHQCQQEPLPPGSIAPKPQAGGPTKKSDSLEAPDSPAVPQAPAPKPIRSPRPIASPQPKDTLAAPRVQVPADSGPYLWADPWGGRHFDSVRVSLHCREGCLLLYSLEDSVHFKSYETPLVFKRNATLWISGIDSLNRQAPAVRVEYVVERNPGACKGNAMPFAAGGKTVCMDRYEWPDSEGAVPRAFVSQKEAEDSCKSVGKRLCTEAEWRGGCQGPDKETYPYGARYNENHCPAKEAAASRSGRFPVCRSYYGLYDMTGNLWEWTATPAPDADFFMVAGGNWTAGNEATCSYAKYSFYPSVRYPFVGFRCCQDAGASP